MEIAPGVTADDWKRLDLTEPQSRDWEQAIDILRCRILERYLDPIELLLRHEEQKHYKERRFGFTVVAICCLLIETLQSFADGRRQTKTGTGAKVFCTFLSSSPNLGKHFTKPLAERFYREYRNGILHQGQTKNGALVWSEFEVVQEIDGTMVVNRTELYRLLKADFEEYLKRLADPKESELRERFVKKMSYVAE